MIKKYTFFVLAFITLSISSLCASDFPFTARITIRQTTPPPADPVEKPQHPSVAAIVTIVGIKCMRVPGIRQIALLPFGIGCTVYGINELCKHPEVAQALDKATKKVKSTVTLPAMMAIFNQCKVKAQSMYSELFNTTPHQYETPVKKAPFLDPLPASAPKVQPSGAQQGNGLRSSSR